MIPNDRGTIQRLMNELRLDNRSVTTNYLKSSLLDTLEYLVRSNVFYQVAHWRCEYCGHLNSRSFDRAKVRNECDICATEHFTPIDVKWKYELSDFVYRSLKRHSGLPVLWAIGFLQDRMLRGSFWYLPEVDLFETDSDSNARNEIDVLCIRDGSFYAIEAKRSASLFLNKAGAREKFVKIIELLRPDVAMLAFERYCAEEANVETTKATLAEAGEAIREQIGPWTKLEIFVAQDVRGFNEFSADLGSYGPRVHQYN